jgi:hypothetical protein
VRAWATSQVVFTLQGGSEIVSGKNADDKEEQATELARQASVESNASDLKSPPADERKGATARTAEQGAEAAQIADVMTRHACVAADFHGHGHGAIAGRGVVFAHRAAHQANSNGHDGTAP